MRYIKIDAENQLITEGYFSSDVKTRLKEMQELVGGYIEAVHPMQPNNDTLFVNEEGLFEGYQHGFYWGSLPLMGNGIVCGFDPKTGDTIACKSSVGEISAKTIMYKLGEPKDEKVTA